MKFLRTFAIGCILLTLVAPKGFYSFVLDIPHIFSHYHDHNEHSAHSGLWGFIDEHFIHTSHHSTGTHDHSTPSDESNVVNNGPAFIYCTVIQKSTFDLSPQYIGNVKLELHQSLRLSDAISTIWQPPRA